MLKSWLWSCVLWGRREAGWSVTSCCTCGGNLNTWPFSFLFFKVLLVDDCLLCRSRKTRNLCLPPRFSCDFRKLLNFWQFEDLDYCCLLSSNEFSILTGCKRDSKGLPSWRSGWESACQCRGHGFEPWSGKIPHAVEQPGPCATTTELARLEPVLRNERLW